MAQIRLLTWWEGSCDKAVYESRQHTFMRETSRFAKRSSKGDAGIDEEELRVKFRRNL